MIVSYIESQIKVKPLYDLIGIEVLELLLSKFQELMTIPSASYESTADACLDWLCQLPPVHGDDVGVRLQQKLSSFAFHNYTCAIDASPADPESIHLLRLSQLNALDKMIYSVNQENTKKRCQKIAELYGLAKDMIDALPFEKHSHRLEGLGYMVKACQLWYENTGEVAPWGDVEALQREMQKIVAAKKILKENMGPADDTFKLLEFQYSEQRKPKRKLESQELVLGEIEVEKPTENQRFLK